MPRDNNLIDAAASQADTERLKQRSLRIMQAIALGLLVFAALVFALARSRHGLHPGWAWVEAFCEAAMVGAIADWFAVSALFRHPLGIPLWHTAIIPDSKDEIGKSLGEFVETHFITEQAISARLRDADVARMAGHWLLDPAHSAQAAALLARGMEQLMPMLDQRALRETLRATASAELARLDAAALASQCVDALVADGQPARLLDLLLERLAQYLSDTANRPAIERAFEELAGDNIVMKTVMGLAKTGIINTARDKIVEMRMDRGHPLRKQADDWIADSALRLRADPAWHDSIAGCQRQVLGSVALQDMLAHLWDGVRHRLLAQLDNDRAAFQATVQTWLEGCARLLLCNVALRAGLNDMLLVGSKAMVNNYRGAAGRFIETQLAQWSKEHMATRIELAIGRDLQFIRINGTLVGGLIGVCIHGLKNVI